MRTHNVRMFLTLVAVLTFSLLLYAQNPQPAYLNTSLPAPERAADLVHRMTVEEKVTQLVNQSRAIPRLNVPDYDWWSEALHGVATAGTTAFPEPIGLAATFDPDSIHGMANVISIEGRTLLRRNALHHEHAAL
jgi:beta-glucosidase